MGIWKLQTGMVAQTKRKCQRRRKKNGTNQKVGEETQESCSKKKREMSQRKRLEGEDRAR